MKWDDLIDKGEPPSLRTDSPSINFQNCINNSINQKNIYNPNENDIPNTNNSRDMPVDF